MNRPKRDPNLKKSLLKAICIFAVLSLLYLGIGYLRFTQTDPVQTRTVIANTAAETPVGEIVAGTAVLQTFPVGTRIDRLDVKFATYCGGKSGTVEVTVCGEQSGAVYAAVHLNAAHMEDNAYVEIPLDAPILPEKDRSCALCVTADGSSGNAVTIWSSNADGIEGGVLTVNGEARLGDLVLTLQQDRTAVFWDGARIAVLLCIALSAALLAFPMAEQAWRSEVLFSACALLLGLIYLFVMTPLAIPDEAYHYHSSYRLSNALLLRPDSELGKAADFDYTGFVGHENVASGYDRIARELLAPAEAGGETVIPMPRGLSYFIEYLPQSAGIAIGRLTGQNFVRTFYLGRLCNLLFYVAMLFFTLRRAPKFKLILGLAAITPMALHQAASFSYDGFINAVSFFLIASLLKCIFEEGELSWKDYACVLVAGALLAPAKVVYTPIILPVLLIPAARFHSKAERWVKLAAVFLACIVLILVFQLSDISRIAGTAERSLNWEGQYNYDIAFVLHNPVQTAKIFCRTLLDRGVGYVTTCFGGRLAGLSLRLSPWIIALFMALFLAAALFGEKGTGRLTVGPRLLLLGIVCVVGVSVMASMFLAWTSNTRPIIEGVQGRYFLPVLPLLGMGLSTDLVLTRRDTRRFYPVCALTLHACVFTEIVRYTYCH